MSHNYCAVHPRYSAAPCPPRRMRRLVPVSWTSHSRRHEQVGNVESATYDLAMADALTITDTRWRRRIVHRAEARSDGTLTRPAGDLHRDTHGPVTARNRRRNRTRSPRCHDGARGNNVVSTLMPCSTDPDDDTLTFSWTGIRGHIGFPRNTTVIYPESADGVPQTIVLTVTDSAGNVATAQKVVVPMAPAA